MSITNPFSLYSQIQFFTALFCTSSCAISNVNFAVDSSILPTYWSTVMLSLRVCVCVCIEFQTISTMFGVCWFIQYIVCCDRVTHSVIRFMQNAFDSILKNHFCDKLLFDVVGHDTFFFGFLYLHLNIVAISKRIAAILSTKHWFVHKNS